MSRKIAENLKLYLNECPSILSFCCLNTLDFVFMPNSGLNPKIGEMSLISSNVKYQDRFLSRGQGK
jgi:hypothetical protein